MATADLVVTPLRSERLQSTSNELRRIYESSFPPYERDPFEQIFVMAGRHQVWIASLNQIVVGFADVLRLDHTLMLRYLAVDEPFRSQGIGQAMLGTITDAVTDATDRIVFEVEEPGTTGDPMVAARRINFYEKWGAHQVRCIPRYFYPNPLDIRMRLPIILYERHIGAANCLAGNSLREVLRSMYDHYYGSEAAELHLNELWARVTC